MTLPKHGSYSERIIPSQNDINKNREELKGNCNPETLHPIDVPYQVKYYASNGEPYLSVQSRHTYDQYIMYLSNKTNKIVSGTVKGAFNKKGIIYLQIQIHSNGKIKLIEESRIINS